MKPLSEVTRNLLKPCLVAPTDRLIVSLNSEGTKFTITLRSIDEHGVWGPASSEARYGKWLAALPERKTAHSQADSYEVGCTDYCVAILSATWKQKQIAFQDELTHLRWAEILLRIQVQDSVQDICSAFENGETVDVSDVKVSETLPLAYYQRVACKAASLVPGFALFMEQGTGKTGVAITRMCNLAEREYEKTGKPIQVLVVCPKNVRLNWENEIARFTTCGGYITVMRGRQTNRLDQMLDALRPPEGCKFTVIITSYETMINTFQFIQLINWDLVVLDESHFIKTPSAKRTKYCLKLRDKARNRMILTGTPVTNSPLDMYSQLEFLGPGYSGFSNFEGFKNHYGVFELTSAGYQKMIGLQNLPMMKERIARSSFIVRKEVALPDLPAKVYDCIEVEMTDEQEKAYSELEDTLMFEIEGMINSATSANEAVVAQNILVKLLRLAQVTSGFLGISAVLDEDGSVLAPARIIRLSENPKLDALVELLKDPEKPTTSKTIVWACFVPDIEAIQGALTAAGIKHVSYYGEMSDNARDAAVKAFNEDPTVKAFIGNPAAGGVGLNLLGYPPGREAEYDTNCDHEVYFSQSWSLTARAQSEDRAHRRGTRGPVRITDLQIPGTIDQEIRARVTAKREVALQLQDVRGILSELRASRK